MLGVILCGGQSSRMGSDKGLLKPGATTWAQTATNKMAALNIPVKISINSDQYKDYEALFPATDLIIDHATLLLKGPLLGVLSSHLAFPKEDLFILACDMPLMEISLLYTLYRSYIILQCCFSAMKRHLPKVHPVTGCIMNGLTAWPQLHTIILHTYSYFGVDPSSLLK